MKKSIGLVVLIACFVVISVIVVYFAKTDTSTKPVVDSITPSAAEATASQHAASVQLAVADESSNVPQQSNTSDDNMMEDRFAKSHLDIQNCLGNTFSSVSMDKFKDELLEKFQLPLAQIDQVEYLLRGPNHEDIRVQKNSNAPINEVVRVFRIDSEGMPDIIATYPMSTSDNIDNKINGALSLGNLQSTIEHFKSQRANSVLEYEVNQNKVSSLRFSKAKVQLTCDLKKIDSMCECTRY